MSCRTLPVPCRALALNTRLNILTHFARITKSGGLGWILLLHIIKFLLSLRCHHVPHLSLPQSIAMKATTCLAFMGGLPLFLLMVHEIHIKFHFMMKNFDLRWSSQRNKLARRLQARLHNYQGVIEPHYPLIEELLLT